MKTRKFMSLTQDRAFHYMEKLYLNSGFDCLESFLKMLMMGFFYCRRENLVCYPFRVANPSATKVRLGPFIGVKKIKID